jgi:hypothetical protein
MRTALLIALSIIASPAVAAAVSAEPSADVLLAMHYNYQPLSANVAARQAVADCEARKGLVPGASVSIQVPTKRCPTYSGFDGKWNREYGPIKPGERKISLRWRLRFF